MEARLLLETKLYPPQPPTGLVPRPELLARLDEGLSRRLTLVSAPAGFGKTTLLAAWAATCPLPLAWLTLDEDDNDPARFLSYLVAALARIRPDLLAEFQKSGGVSLDFTHARMTLPPLINAIQHDPTPLILVLDDLHLVEAQSIHDALAFLLEHQPPQLHLVIASRSDPLLPLSRLRARGQLLELRVADLRFTPVEATAFLGHVTGLDLSAADVARLLKRTEGWAAGLQLAGLSLQRQQDVSAFIAAFTGSHIFVADYLQDEVLSLQPEELQSFLLKTSILDRLNGDLCNTLTGVSDGQVLLEHLKEKNLFLQALDDERRWYRYHGLFADLLRHQLQLKLPEQVPALHRKASDWYAARGFQGEAIQHALQAGDEDYAADLIETAAEETLMRSEINTLIRWIGQLGSETVRARSTLCVYYAWALLLSGKRWEQVEYWLEALQTAEGEIPARALPLYAYVALMQGNEARASQFAHQALTDLPPEERFLHSITLWIASIADLGQADLSVRVDALSQAVNKLKDTGNLMLLVLSLCAQAEMRLWQGRLLEAEMIYQQALTLSGDTYGNLLPVAGEALIGLGELAREWNDLETATELLEEGLDLTRQWSELAALDGYLGLSLVRQAQGDFSEADSLMRRAREIAAASDSTELDDLMVELAQARLWIQQGRLELAWRWVQDREVQKPTSIIENGIPADIESRLHKYFRLAYAHLLLAEGRPAEALPVLSELIPLVRARGRVRAVIEGLLLQAIAHQALQDHKAAMESLGQALKLAQPAGFVRLILDAGPPVIQLLYQAVEEGIAADYAGHLLATLPALQPLSPSDDQDSYIEALTQREQEVLALLSQGHSNQEIARILVLAPSTVKVHTRNIYRKLDVNNRLQAVTRARQLGIL